MFRKLLAHNISYPLQDLVNGTKILPTYKFLLQSQYWPLEKLEEYQFGKFIRLLHHAYENVPFYKDLYTNAGLKPEDIRSRDDIKHIPIVTKEKAREFNQQMVVNHYNIKKTIKGVTGGTTGPPLKLLRDQQDQTFVWAAFYRWYNWMGIDIGDKVTKIWGTPTVLSYPFKKRVHDHFKNFYYNRQLLNSFDLNEETIPGLIEQIRSFKPKLIRGYLSALVQIAEFVNEKGMDINYAPKAISSTTETLIPAFKKLIEDTFHTKIYDQYGCGECNSIAFDAGDGNGLYLALEHALIEILDINGNDAGYNDGRIIMTNLDNYTMPFIRYENGDWGSFNEKVYTSKITLPALKRISGRTADTIILKNNSKVHGVFFTDILNELFGENPTNIHRFQVYQNKPGEVEFRVESKLELDEQYEKAVGQALNKFFSNFEIVRYDELPRDKSGKFRYVVSDVNDE